MKTLKLKTTKQLKELEQIAKENKGLIVIDKELKTITAIDHELKYKFFAEEINGLYDGKSETQTIANLKKLLKSSYQADYKSDIKILQDFLGCNE